MLVLRKWFITAHKVWLVWMLLVRLTSAATILQPGDLQLVGYSSDSPDSVSWVTWVPIDEGTEIRFTDNGWKVSGEFRSGESDALWTAGSPLVAGTVVVFTAGSAPSSGSTVGQLSGLSASGDQVLAFQGSVSSPKFVYGLDFNGSNEPPDWDSDATSTRTSALPDALKNDNLAVKHFDNGEYSGPKSGLAIDEFQTLVQDRSNWTFSNSNSFGPLSSDSFNISESTATPEPRSWLLWMGVAGSFLLVHYVMKGRRF